MGNDVRKHRLSSHPLFDPSASPATTPASSGDRPHALLEDRFGEYPPRLTVFLHVLRIHQIVIVYPNFVAQPGHPAYTKPDSGQAESNGFAPPSTLLNEHLQAVTGASTSIHRQDGAGPACACLPFYTILRRCLHPSPLTHGSARLEQAHCCHPRSR